jgi:hypothetical protein
MTRQATQQGLWQSARALLRRAQRQWWLQWTAAAVVMGALVTAVLLMPDWVWVRHNHANADLEEIFGLAQPLIAIDGLEIAHRRVLLASLLAVSFFAALIADGVDRLRRSASKTSSQGDSEQ